MAIWVKTNSAVVFISNGTPADQTATTDEICTAQAETWVNGLFTDASDQTGNFKLSKGSNTEFQFCI